MVCSAGIGPGERLQARARRGLQPIRERFRLCPLHLCRTLRVQAMCRLRSMATAYKRKDSGYGTAPATPRQSPARRGMQPIRERFRLCPLHLGSTLRVQAMCRLRSIATSINGKIPAMPYQCFALVKPAPGTASAALDSPQSAVKGEGFRVGLQRRYRPLRTPSSPRPARFAGNQGKIPATPAAPVPYAQGQAVRRLRSMVISWR